MIIVTGGNGQLANCIKEFLPEAIYLNSQEGNVENYSKLEDIIRSNSPEYVINCAAYTAVDFCETNEESARKVNAEGAKNLAILSKKYNFSLIHISTDYVFDGNAYSPYKESDPTNPLSAYGKTKLEGEHLIKKHSDSFLIIRTSWLYSKFGKNFVKNIRSLMEGRKEIGIVYDQTGSPTNAHDLAHAISLIVSDKKNIDNEIYHYANSGVASWFDIASEVKIFFNIDCNVFPIESFEYPTPARRPKYSVLNTRKIKQTFNTKIPYWRESLISCLKEMSS